MLKWKEKADVSCVERWWNKDIPILWKNMFMKNFVSSCSLTIIFLWSLHIILMLYMKWDRLYVVQLPKSDWTLQMPQNGLIYWQHFNAIHYLHAWVVCWLFMSLNIGLMYCVPYYLDPMHIFKNVLKSIIANLFGEKYNIVARLNLHVSNIKQNLWVQFRSSFIKSSLASYKLGNKIQIRKFIRQIKKIKPPRVWSSSK